ncbi:microcin C ABC transporter permease YejB [Haematospirillum sp. H1815]|uniref:microcin C ABC transporter permease YejB n=1 Tax=Haematospirillum sp. H1815 TaxID=2723108 RepID=UPI0014395B6C|nr:microcin C ABC transporter permease YejB [Haematospirillum sp. H1815]NKD77573.1 microcin C ABC transporter permease YejB [Haematospirillum sp. H1815]
MGSYVLRRLLLIPLTLLGIMTVNFFVIQTAPGGPVEQTLLMMTEATGGLASESGAGETTLYRGKQGLDDEHIEHIRKQFGFDRPLHERYLMMLADYARFELGESFYQSKPVTEMVIDALPVSISLGVLSTLIIYIISIPLGILKAIRSGSRLDGISSWIVVVGYAVPSFMFAILFIIFLAGGRFLDWFPMRGLASDDFHTLSWAGQVLDWLWHMTLPVTAMVMGGFASLTLLTRNSFLEEISKQYVITARAKGLTERRVLYGHVFRNAMLIVIAGFPATLIAMFLTGSILIESIFSLNGLGLLGFEAVVRRDYPVVFGTLYIFGLIGLVMNLASDIALHLVDPRITFESAP